MLWPPDCDLADESRAVWWHAHPAGEGDALLDVPKTDLGLRVAVLAARDLVGHELDDIAIVGGAVGEQADVDVLDALVPAVLGVGPVQHSAIEQGVYFEDGDNGCSGVLEQDCAGLVCPGRVDLWQLLGLFVSVHHEGLVLPKEIPGKSNHAHDEDGEQLKRRIHVPEHLVECGVGVQFFVAHRMYLM